MDEGEPGTAGSPLDDGRCHPGAAPPRHPPAAAVRTPAAHPRARALSHAPARTPAPYSSRARPPYGSRTRAGPAPLVRTPARRRRGTAAQAVSHPHKHVPGCQDRCFPTKRTGPPRLTTEG
ncbi:hypothetical protein ACE1SV_31140 [Streptomyces sennicomposti]